MGSVDQRGVAWFTAVYEEHYDAVRRYVLRRLRDPSASEELTQEVFVITWRRRTRAPEHCLPWLYGIARRVLANDRRAGRTRPALVSLPGDDVLRDRREDPARGAQHVDVHRAMDALSETDREILRLVGWEGLDVGDAARVLGRARGTVRVRLFRARRRLAKALENPASDRENGASAPSPAVIEPLEESHA
ncbi:RNA polymerase sigma-70 factor, ECF subfamily [Actinopolyspora lacussalsi subsp. righensis]|uniref:RNA polymerase sigma-70 factor, ECF subfamily n=1 Tax=Actinopolyspora righensis TaxID=995060 RepID=A0A1I7BZI5_9ACTN|nr:sigma-70 family RNA polymerase sigma factor [Actinopolyspora righensis]SFT92580.1 RNA polymerase sigma-70 factor, ECF subfamily [Actinopolyspora righensis]